MLLAIFAVFASQIASWPFLFLSLEFCQIWKSCYFCDICYSVFLGSKKSPFSLSKSRILSNLEILLFLRYLLLGAFR